MVAAAGAVPPLGLLVLVGYLHLFPSISLVVGVAGGLWIALEMPRRKDVSPRRALAIAAGLGLRHGGMLLIAIVLLEAFVGASGLGPTPLRGSPAVSGASAAVFVWLALWSRFLGSLVLAAVDGIGPTRIETRTRAVSGRTVAIGGGVAFVLVALLFLAPIVAAHDPYRSSVETFSGPTGAHWLGTDQLGRDTFSRVVHGGRSAAELGVPMAILALLTSIPMVVARIVLDGAGMPRLLHGVEGVLEGLVSVPWLTLGILIQMHVLGEWPLWAGLAIVLVPRALRVGWALGAGERLRRDHLALAALQAWALLMAASLALIFALGYLGLGSSPPTPDWSLMLVESRPFVDVVPGNMIFPGVFITVVTVAWLVMATLFSQSDSEHRPAGCVHALS